MGSLSNKTRIGVVTNRYGQVLANEVYPHNPIFAYEDSSELLDALTDGKVDAGVISLSSASELLKSRYLGKLTVIPSTLDHMYQPVGLAVQKDNDMLRDLLNKALNAIPPTRYSELEHRWNTVTLSQGIPYKEILFWGAIICAVISLIVGIIFYWNRKLSREVEQRKTFEQQLTYLTNNIDGALVQHIQHSADPTDITLMYVSEK